MADNLVVGHEFDGETGLKTGEDLEDMVALAELASATPLLDQVTLEDFDNGGTRGARVKAGSIGTAHLAPGAVTPAKLGSVIAFSVHNNDVDQDIAEGDLYQPLDFSTEDFDVGGCWASDKFTPDVEGIYLLHGRLLVVSVPVGGEVIAGIAKNGVVIKWGATYRNMDPGVEGFGSDVTVLMYANGTTDYFELCAWSSGASTSVVDGDTKRTWFIGHFVTPHTP